MISMLCRFVLSILELIRFDSFALIVSFGITLNWHLFFFLKTFWKVKWDADEKLAIFKCLLLYLLFLCWGVWGCLVEKVSHYFI
jgi:hypothetical protein